jgi:hypothetical protein
MVRRAPYQAADGTRRERFIRAVDIDDPIAAVDAQIDRLRAFRAQLLRQKLEQAEPLGWA